ncbi:hypothetical protein SDJN02_04815, partial [Cucurbita argyrosperma subsp. argyrosperma]
MGMVVVISLPLILFCFLLGFGCYFLGRAKGRQDIRTNAQVFGVPAPPPGSGLAHPPPPPEPLFKPDNSAHDELQYSMNRFAVIVAVLWVFLHSIE